MAPPKLPPFLPTHHLAWLSYVVLAGDLYSLQVVHLGSVQRGFFVNTGEMNPHITPDCLSASNYIQRDPAGKNPLCLVFRGAFQVPQDSAWILL